ncbi:hypothetical protein DZC18_001876 [Clostridium beijerinckii]|nr:hypothetical protein [Clostridium beijerinckii]
MMNFHAVKNLFIITKIINIKIKKENNIKILESKKKTIYKVKNKTIKKITIYSQNTGLEGFLFLY